MITFFQQLIKTTMNREALSRLTAWRTRPGDLKWQLRVLDNLFGQYMSPENKTRDKRSSIVSRYTRHQRIKFLRLFINQLHACGYHPQFLDNIRVHHVKAVVSAWEQKGLVTRVLQTRLSAIRMLFAWMGRAHGLPANRMLLSKHHWRSRSVATRDKTWAGNGLDVFQVIKQVPKKYMWIRFSLALQRCFGLRVKESMLIHIHSADGGDVLRIRWGAKGGRSRDIPIETSAQRDLIERIKAFVPVGESLIGPLYSKSLLQARHEYDNVISKMLGINRKTIRVTSHGLRCEYLCEQYLKFTGETAPIKGGRPIDPALDRAARDYIAKLAGHNRRGVASAYLGAVLRSSKKQK